MSVKVRDNGFKKRMAALHKPTPSVSVGVHADDGAATKDSGITVAEVAAIHEFGLGVPERSWLRDFVDENQGLINRELKAIGERIARGADGENEMNRFGLVMVGMIKERIVAGIDPALAESTLASKLRITGAPKETPLILFGQLISSIASRVNA